jgi:hypothetical protein
MSFRLRSWGLAAVLASLALAGCRDGQAPEPAQTSSLASKKNRAVEPVADSKLQAVVVDPIDAQALGAFKIVAVNLGNAVDADHNVVIDQRRFTPRNTIYASVLSIGEHPGLTLSATWTAADDRLIAHSEQRLAPNSPTATTFSVRHPGAWPVGDYRVVIAVQEQPMESRVFEVR